LDTDAAAASAWLWDIVAIGGVVPPRGPALLPLRAHFALSGKRFVELTDFVPTLRALALSGFGASTGINGRCDMWALRPQFATLVAMDCA